MVKYLLLLLFLIGCSPNPSQEVLNLKYGDIKTVDDAFYGKGVCSVKEKLPYWGSDRNPMIELYCVYSSGYKGRMVYEYAALKPFELTEKKLLKALEEIKENE